MRLNKYLYSQITLSFFPIFLSLFFITSLIFLVRIASLTSVITISLWELFLLYSYMLPNILFYTLPISFFISLIVAIAKLSNEYEIIVITSFGYDPKRIIKFLFPITLLLSLTLIILSIGLIPKAKALTREMLEVKKIEANFNIKASEFGQKFADWLIYIEEDKGQEYKEVKLFKLDKEKNTEQFILAKKAKIVNEEGSLKFIFETGKTFNISDKEFNQIDFRVMSLNNSLNQDKLTKFEDPISYWKERFAENEDTDKFSFYILASLFPLVSLGFVIILSYFNPRYEKNRSTAIAIVLTVIFYLLSNSLSRSIGVYSIVIIPIIWIIASYFIYNKRVKAIY